MRAAVQTAGRAGAFPPKPKLVSTSWVAQRARAVPNSGRNKYAMIGAGRGCACSTLKQTLFRFDEPPVSDADRCGADRAGGDADGVDALDGHDWSQLARAMPIIEDAVVATRKAVPPVRRARHAAEHGVEILQRPITLRTAQVWRRPGGIARDVRSFLHGVTLR